VPATPVGGLSGSPIPPKPRFRGRIHQAAFFVSIPAAIVLGSLARTAVARTAAIVYGVAMIALFGTSAAYHRLNWKARGLAVMRRLDHSMIFVLIAGTYTPITLLVMRKPWSVVLLSVVVTGAVAGILIKVLAFDRLKVLGSSLYIILGWAVVLAGPQIVRGLAARELIPLIAGGLLYTFGALVLATKKPNPSPRVFGYHEVFHLSTVAAGICHYVAVVQIVLALR
jgi:hemolysin III